MSHKQPQSDLGIDYIPIIQALGRLGPKELEYGVRFDYIEFRVHYSSTLSGNRKGEERGKKEGVSEEGGRERGEGKWGGERREADRKEDIEMKSSKLDHISFPWKILYYPTPGFWGKPLSLLHVPSHKAQTH